MASAIVGALKVILSMDTAEYNTAAKQVAASAKAMSSQFNDVGRQATAVGSALTRTITLPMVALGAGAVKLAMDFESSFAGVRKTVDATEPEFAALAQGLRDMAKEIPVNVNELNKVAEAAGQLGIKKDDILSFTRTMADLGVTTNLTADEAATATAQIQNIFGAAGKDVDRFGATLVALGNAGASTEKDIIEMGLRIAGAGKQVGLTQAQVLAFASALSSVGINAEAGGSAISRVFLKINDAVAKGGSGLAEFARISGMSAGDFKQAWEKDAAAATTAFISGLARLKAEGENVNATLEGVVGKNIILKDTLLRASGAGSLLTEQLALGNRAWQENTALTKEAQERYKTFESQITVLWNRVKDVGIELGTSLLPVLKDLIKVTEPLVKLLAQSAEMFAKLPEPIRLTATAAGALVASVGPLLWLFGSITTAVGTVIKAFTAKGIAMRALTASYEFLAPALTAIGGSFVAIGALAAALAASLYAVGKAFVDLYGHWKSGQSMWDFFSARDDDNFIRRWLGLSKGVRETDIALSGAAAAAVEFVGPMERVNAVASQTDEELKAAKKSADEFAKSLKSFGGREAMAGAQEVIKQLAALGGPLNVLPSKLADMAGRLREAAQAALMMGKSGLADQYTKLADTLDPMVQFQQRYNVTIGEYVTLAPQAASWTEDLVDQLNRLGGTVTTIGPALKSSLILPWTTFKATVAEYAPGIVRSFDNIGAAVSNMGNTILAAVQGGGSVLASIGSSFGGALGKDIADNMSKTFKLFGSSLLGDALKSMLPGVGALLGPALTAIGSGFKKLFGIGINDEVKKANGEIAKMRDELLKTHGPLEVLEAKANAVGLSFAENWGHQGKAGLDAFNKLVDEFNRRWEELQAKRQELENQLKSTQGEFDGLIGKARDLGYEFDQTGQLVGVNFDTLKQKAEEFGVDINSLGPALRQQALDAEASKIINGFTLMAKAGGDVGGILVGMKDEIGKVVGDSIKFGTTIPANMQPWIEELIRTDQLTDENGQKIDDLSKIKFGEPVKTEFEKISSALLEVVNALNDILAQIAAIPTEKTFTIRKQYADAGAPSGFFAGGGDAPSGEPGFAVGTMGRLGQWFGSFPKAGFETALHGLEAVVTPQQSVPFAMDVLSSLGGGTPAMAGDAGLLQEMQGLRRDLQSTIPTLVADAARYGAQTAGRRR